MTKETIKIAQGHYGPIDTWHTEATDKLIEWSKKPENLDKKVYSHRVRYNPFEVISIDEKGEMNNLVVHYLDIYWQ